MKLLYMVALVGLTAGCNASDNNGDQDLPLVFELLGTAFATPGSDGTIGISLNESGQNRLYDTATGNGVAYKIGVNNSGSMRAYSGLLEGSDVVAPPKTGTATMTGRFALYGADRIRRVRDRTSWYEYRDSGNVKLVADFANGTLKSQGGDLGVNGKFSGKTMTGTVKYNGIDGQLKGLVGENQTVGAFHGYSEAQAEVYTGGFIAER